MRRLILASTFALSACATAPQLPQTEPQTTQTAPAQPQTRRLLGLTAQELVGNLGNPQLQVREGNSLKLQFRSSRCVLDAYLYPTGNSTGPLRVTYVETGTPAGAGTDQAACVSAFEHPI